MAGWRTLCLKWLLPGFLAAALLQPATAQDRPLALRSAVLTIDSEQLFAGSAYGQRVLQEQEVSRSGLIAENRRIETELQEEERQLTEQRAEMDPKEFRVLADAFDEKVQQIRTEQVEKLRHLNSQNDEARRRFVAAATPVLEEIMQQAGATVIVESSSVFMSARAVDITQFAITRLDALIGDGAPQPELILTPAEDAAPPQPADQ